jgi:hypothetical protein
MEFWKTLTVVVSLDVQQDVVTVKKNRIEVYWFLFLLRLHKFSRPEYRPERLDGDDTWFNGIFEEQ